MSGWTPQKYTGQVLRILFEHDDLTCVDEHVYREKDHWFELKMFVMSGSSAEPDLR